MIIGRPLGKRSEPRVCPYYLERKKRASKKILNGVTENASLGKIY